MGPFPRRFLPPPARPTAPFPSSAALCAPPRLPCAFTTAAGLRGSSASSPPPRLDELYVAAITAVNPEVKANALRAAGDIKFDQYAEVPIVWLPSQIAINPNEVGEFVWPGNINTAITHMEYITTAQ